MADAAGMKATTALLVAALMTGCGWNRHYTLRPEIKPQYTKETADQKFREDKAYCMERGYALQTYSGSSYYYEGTGGGSSGSNFNAAVMASCLEARGWMLDRKVPTTLGMEWY